MFVKAGINMAQYSMAAAQEKPLVDAGWDGRTLGNAFQINDEASKGKGKGKWKGSATPQYHSNSDCGCYFGGGCGYLVEVEWVQIL